jgi:hypothetical protein
MPPVWSFRGGGKGGRGGAGEDGATEVAGAGAGGAAGVGQGRPPDPAPPCIDPEQGMRDNKREGDGWRGVLG